MVPSLAAIEPWRHGPKWARHKGLRHVRRLTLPLAAVAYSASYNRTGRATRLDPLVALRHE